MDFTKIAILSIDRNIADYDVWAGSLFESIKFASTCKKGAIGETIIKNIFNLTNHTVKHRTSVEHDLIIDGEKAEIKLSCYNSSGYFKWLQIRPDDDFEVLYLISVYPNQIKIYKLSKLLINQLINSNIIKPQHGGKKNTNFNIKYLGIKDKNKPDWFTACEVIIL